MSDRPNVVLICVDQWRGDCLSIAGHPVVHTPYLDQLAYSGVRFNRAYAATPTCIAARASLFTGLTPESHGRIGYKDGIPWNYPVTIASEFTRHGYQTQAVGKMHVHPARYRAGFEHVILHDGYLHFQRNRTHDITTFDDYLPWLRQHAGPQADYFDHGLNCNSYVARPWDKPEYLHPTNFVVSESLNFLRRRDPTRPFFLFMSFHRPHPPYDPPAWAFEQYLNANMPAPPVGNWVDDFAAFRADPVPEAAVARARPEVLQRARAGYYGHMTHIDHQLNRFMETLQEYSLRHNTIVCFVSDHGELLGDHHLYRKSLPYEGSARVPLIFHHPQSGIRPNTTFEQPVELRDVMPTLMDLANLPIPSSVEGQSLAPYLRGQKTDRQDWRSFLHGEHATHGGSSHYLTDGREKYVWLSWSNTEQLFDLAKDPQERCDLARDPATASRLAPWRERLIKHLASREEGFVENGRLVRRTNTPPIRAHLQATS